MTRHWTIRASDEGLAAEIASGLGLPVALAAVLIQRGCTTVDQAEQFLHPSLASLRDPFELPDMAAAVARIRRALHDRERITVFGDYDVDGVCSTALLVRMLRAMGGTVSFFIPGRLDEGYGLTIAAAQACVAASRPALVITVDCGTNAAEAAGWLKAQGIDVIVTDHHEPEGSAMPDGPVVNPKREPDHPGRMLCGAGVAFKLCHALVKEGRETGCPVAATVDLKECLEEVAVATVADMVPLCGENRALVRAGLQRLDGTSRPGWQALRDQCGVTVPAQSWHAGFVLGPRINAAGRLGRADDALELLLTHLPERARELALVLEDANRERQGIERDMVRDAMEEIDSWFSSSEHYGLVIAREGWHRGVVGIVASRLVARYHRPVAVIGIEDGSGRGSCRGIESFDLLECLRSCSDLLERFGGHSMAAGLEVSARHLDAFKQRFNDAAGDRLRGEDLRPVLRIDRVLSLAEADEALLQGLSMAGPFGQDHPEPIWAVFGVQAVECRILKERHLKMKLTDGRVERDAIGFNLAEKLPSGTVDAAFTLQENTWRGKKSIQLALRDVRPAQGLGAFRREG